MNSLILASGQQSNLGLIIGLSVVGFVLLLAIIFVVWLIVTYNKFVKYKNNIEESFSNMDVYLNKRYDLIPNLVETVKGYAKHEQETMESVMQARYAAMNSSDGTDKFKKENALTGTLKSLFRVTENYPNLKADKHFTDLMNNLSRIEDEIMNSRKYYNAVVKEYNNHCVTIPSNLVAKWFKFEKATLFEVEDKEVRKNVKVKF